MTGRRWFAWILLLVVFVMSGCKDKSGHSRAGSSASAPAGAARPLIGLTCVYRPRSGRGAAHVRVNADYIRSVVESGGVPVVLPVNGDERTAERYVRLLDGLVLIGGADIPPAAYGEKPLEQVRAMHPKRYEFERKVILLWLAGEKPLLGVCLGCQFANVVAGGTLIQDIPAQVGTKVVHRGADHPIIIEPGSRLRKILGAERVIVNSSHHQAVGDPGRGLKVVARSEDGVIEALEMTDKRFCLLVQWHPERMDDVEHRKAIFGSLVRACKKK